MNRLRYLVQRIAFGIPVIWFGLTMTFVILYMGPIDPVTSILGRKATGEQALRVAIDLGLRYPNGEPVPLWVQYKDFMVRMITFNFGQSWVLQREIPVTEVIWGRMAATVWLGLWSVLIALGVGIPVGLFGGLNANTWIDYLASFGGIVWRAMPNFWLAVILASAMSGTGPLAWYRDFLITTNVVGTPDALGNLFVGLAPQPTNFLIAFKWIFPAALVLGSASMGNEVRIGRTAVIENMNSKYVETAKAKGVSMRKIVWKHVGRNAVIPLLPVIMGEFYLLIGGSVLVEQIFAINGLGNLYLQAAFRADLPILMALTYVFIIIQVAFNITQDLLYTFIDPRITLEGSSE